MKKLALILVFVLILGCAYAEPVKLNSVEDVYPILYANLFYRRMNNGCALIDFNGNQLTEDIYSTSFTFRKGMLKTYLAQGDGVNRRGIIREDGSEVIPFKYGDVDILSEDWVYGLTLVEADRNNFDYEVSSGDETKVYLIGDVDVYSLETGMVKTFTRENFADIYVNGKTLNIQDRSSGNVISYDVNFNELGVNEEGRIYNDDFAVYEFNKFYEDGKYGGTDANGNVIVQPIYDYLYYPETGEYALIEDENDRVGLMDISGNVIIEPQFDEIEFLRGMPATLDSVYCYDGYVLFEQDGKLGYATAAGITCEPRYSADVLSNNGVSCSFTDMEGNFNIMAADGIVTTITGYKDVVHASYSGGYYYIVSGDNYTEGLIDWHGNVIFPCEQDSVEFSGDGQYLLVSPESYGSYDIYTINEAQEAAPAAAEVPAEAPAAQSGIGSVSVPNVDFSGFSAPAAEAPAAQSGIGSVQVPSVDFSQAAAQAPAADNAGLNASCVNMLASAKSLLAADAAANGAAVQVLIESTASMLAGTPAAGILEGAKALIAVDAAANSAAIITLIDSAIALLG